MGNAKDLLKFKEYLDGRARPGTVSLYMHALHRLFASMNGDTLTKEYAQSYIDKLAHAGISPSTINVRAHAIMRYMRWKGVEVHLDVPSIAMGEPEHLTMDQLGKVIAACQTSLEYVLVVVWFDTAVRASELLNLMIDDIDRELKLITVTRKGGRRDSVNISPKALEALDNWLGVRKSNSKRVFMDLTYNEAWSITRGIGQRVGIPIHPHTFRHSRAIQMLKAKTPIHIVKQHLGHKSIATTIDIYGMFMAAEIKEEIPAW